MTVASELQGANRGDEFWGQEGRGDSGALGRRLHSCIFMHVHMFVLRCASGEHGQLRAGSGICISSLGVWWLLVEVGGGGGEREGEGGSCLAPVAGLFESKHVESWEMNCDAGILPHSHLRLYPVF